MEVDEYLNFDLPELELDPKTPISDSSEYSYDTTTTIKTESSDDNSDYFNANYIIKNDEHQFNPFPIDEIIENLSSKKRKIKEEIEEEVVNVEVERPLTPMVDLLLTETEKKEEVKKEPEVISIKKPVEIDYDYKMNKNATKELLKNKDHSYTMINIFSQRHFDKLNHETNLSDYQVRVSAKLPISVIQAVFILFCTKKHIYPDNLSRAALVPHSVVINDSGQERIQYDCIHPKVHPIEVSLLFDSLTAIAQSGERCILILSGCHHINATTPSYKDKKRTTKTVCLVGILPVFRAIDLVDKLVYRMQTIAVTDTLFLYESYHSNDKIKYLILVNTGSSCGRQFKNRNALGILADSLSGKTMYNAYDLYLKTNIPCILLRAILQWMREQWSRAQRFNHNYSILHTAKYLPVMQLIIPSEGLMIPIVCTAELMIDVQCKPMLDPSRKFCLAQRIFELDYFKDIIPLLFCTYEVHSVDYFKSDEKFTKRIESIAVKNIFE